MEYKITEEQLEKLIERLNTNIHKITDRKGESGMQISQSVSSTIYNYLNKNCSPEFVLSYCPYCLQMTNHINNICQKHKKNV